MSRIPDLLGLDLVWHKDAWQGPYYINGERHAYKKDKLKVKVWVCDGKPGIWLYEQGGESISLLSWLVKYGGAVSPSHALCIISRNENAIVRFGSYRAHRDSETVYVSRNEFKAYEVYELERCPLFTWMCRLFGEQRVRDVWKRYNVTTDNRGLCVYWYVDTDGRICYDKRVKYGYDGKRDHNFGGTRTYTTAKGYTARPLFGAHLIPEDGDFYVVESEKTALLCALAYSDKVFVATGGKNNLRDIDDRAILLPDIDAIEEWRTKGRVCEWWTGWDACEAHSDIGDMIVDKRLRK